MVFVQLPASCGTAVAPSHGAAAGSSATRCHAGSGAAFHPTRPPEKKKKSIPYQYLSIISKKLQNESCIIDDLYISLSLVIVLVQLLTFYPKKRHTFLPSGCTMRKSRANFRMSSSRSERKSTDSVVEDGKRWTLRPAKHNKKTRSNYTTGMFTTPGKLQKMGQY